MAKQFFHVSKRDLGSRVVLKAQIPDSRNPSECGKTKRVCFAPSVMQCLVSVAGINNFAAMIAEFLGNSTIYNPTVYVTDKRLFKPRIVSDFALTDERWSRCDIEVERIGYVDLYKLIFEKEVVICTTRKSGVSKTVALAFRRGRTLSNMEPLPLVKRKGIK